MAGSRENTRLVGHALFREGRAFERIDDQLVYTGDPIGVGLCECGETSAVLTSTNGRRSWHKKIHKPAVREKMAEEHLPR